MFKKGDPVVDTTGTVWEVVSVGDNLTFHTEVVNVNGSERILLPTKDLRLYTGELLVEQLIVHFYSKSYRNNVHNLLEAFNVVSKKGSDNTGNFVLCITSGNKKQLEAIKQLAEPLTSKITLK